MGEIRYIISDASKKIDVEQHTLRYWEEELELHILRNEMGHRYYREEDIELLKAVKVLKEKGYQLRAIKMLLPKIQKLNNSETTTEDADGEEWIGDQQDILIQEGSMNFIPIEGSENNKRQATPENQPQKLEQFREIMTNLIRNVLQESTDNMSDNISEAVSASVIKEMDYLIRMKEEREEERFKQFDRTLRELQSSRAEYAVSKGVKKKKRFFKK
jgi:DNA-binding transcriptional MerR regulator